jgi:hypothetical protein
MPFKLYLFRIRTKRSLSLKTFHRLYIEDMIFLKENYRRYNYIKFNCIRISGRYKIQVAVFIKRQPLVFLIKYIANNG